MKILLAHDPAANEPVPIAALQRCGFPPQSTMLIVAVADKLTPPDPLDVPPLVQRAIDTARHSAADAQTALQHAFPGWHVTTDVITDAPAWGILAQAEEWQPDLIVLGAHRRSMVNRLVLGSVSQKVLKEAHTSVHVIRGAVVDSDPPRLLIGVDGSSDADAAVAALATRAWPQGTTVLVVAVADGDGDTAAESADVRCTRTARQLAALGLLTSTAILTGDPKDALLAEAARWKADCIFVGARGLSLVERILLGSVSAALAARAHCCVEVVRPRAHRV